MLSRLLHRAVSLLGPLLFLCALWALHHQLSEYSWDDLVVYLEALSPHRLRLALALTVASYAVITAYDWLALQYLRKPLAGARVLFASFVSYAFSNSVGVSVLSSGSLRLRLYSGWGLSAIEIAQIVLFSAVTLWLGLLVTAGGVLLAQPVDLAELLHLPALPHGPWLGALLLVPVAGWFALALLRREPLRVGDWTLPVVRALLAARQLVIGAADWLLAAAVLYALLPRVADLGYGHFLAVFLVAQIVALVSHVPGGLGVFEATVIALLAPWVEAGDLLGGLFAFRAIYYLLPLALATVALGLYETRTLGARLGRQAGEALRVAAPAVPVLLPSGLALMAAICGGVLLMSTVSPADEARLAWMHHVVPLPLLEVSHFLGAVIGVGLILLAQGLQRRLDAAWLLSCLLLAAGALAALLKGGDYEEAALLALLLAALVPCRAHFYRRTRLAEERPSAGWLAVTAMAVVAALWLGWFSYKEIDYRHALWWQFQFDEDGEAARFLRTLPGLFALAAAVAVRQLLRPAPPAMALPDAAEAADLARRVAASPHTYAHLARVGDKAILTSPDGDGFLMYAVQGRAWIAMGDPLGTPAERRELAWRLRERAETWAGWTVFYQASPAHLDLYVELGLSLLKIGEEARVELSTFTLDGAARKNLRNTRNRLVRDGYGFRVVPAAEVPALLGQLQAVSDAWLDGKQTREKGFSLGRFEAGYLGGGPVAVIEHAGRIVAFANLWCGAQHAELSVDLMRFADDAPAGAMDALFVELLLWGKAEGYAWFNLGMAPLAGLHARALAPLWNRFGALVFGRGERFYNFRGVRQYKEKFGPVWEPRYLAAPGGLRLPRVLAAVTTLIAGGLSGVVQK
ncbi:bifunctional lysylphosphatidylglycerol flippase/synthetase MprF [Plasticicumulans sp.]|uniref:bifunctional lysylphosphatidylglycerol flippase/synthetase MprF n=1 Tax=Plasticicumulans sp. TaxID=2307179 RepID=UPI00394AA2DB